MAARRVFVVGGATAAAIGAYYMYEAGGDPKVAQRDAEHDAARASRKVKDEIPGLAKEAKTEGKAIGERINSNAKNASDDAKAFADRADAKARSIGSDAAKEASRGIDKFDKKVTEKSGEAKGWLGGLFGGK